MKIFPTIAKLLNLQTLANNAVERIRPAIHAKAVKSLNELKIQCIKDLPDNIRISMHKNYDSLRQELGILEKFPCWLIEEKCNILITRASIWFLDQILSGPNQPLLDELIAEFTKHVALVSDQVLDGADLFLTEVLMEEIKTFFHIIPPVERNEPPTTVDWPIIPRYKTPLIGSLLYNIHKRTRSISKALLPKILDRMQLTLYLATSSMLTKNIQETRIVTLRGKGKFKILELQGKAAKNVCNYIWSELEDDTIGDVLVNLVNMEYNILNAFRPVSKSLPL
jgi:hypothetical protein